MEVTLSGIADIGWVVFAFVALFLLYRTVPLIQKLKFNWKAGQFEIDLRDDLVRAQAELNKQQAEMDVDDTALSKKTVLWATGGSEGAAASARLALETAGFKTESVVPDQAAALLKTRSDEFSVIVTNLKHGSNYSGGLELKKQVDDLVHLPMIVYTSPTAQKRRGKHLKEFETEYIATDLDSLVDCVVSATT